MQLQMLKCLFLQTANKTNIFKTNISLIFLISFFFTFFSVELLPERLDGVTLGRYVRVPWVSVKKKKNFFKRKFPFGFLTLVLSPASGFYGAELEKVSVLTENMLPLLFLCRYMSPVRTLGSQCGMIS